MKTRNEKKKGIHEAAKGKTNVKESNSEKERERGGPIYITCANLDASNHPSHYLSCADASSCGSPLSLSP